MFKFLYSKPLPKEIAKNRLKFILVNDRDGITPYVLDIIKNEILAIITKYVDVESNDVDISLVKSKDLDCKNYSSLVANVPIRNKN